MHSVGGFSGGTVAARGRRAGGSKVDQAYLALKRAIVSGKLAPETPIDKSEWCAIFEVSRLSITTAINRLAFEGLVVVEPQRGSYVARIHLEDVRQWMLTRRALEVEVVGVCAADMSDAAIAALGQNLAYQKAAIASGDLEGFHELDTRFHRQMTESLNLARVGELLDPIRTHLERGVGLYFPSPGGPRGRSASTKRSIGRLPPTSRTRQGVKWPIILTASRASSSPLSPNIPASSTSRAGSAAADRGDVCAGAYAAPLHTWRELYRQRH